MSKGLHRSLSRGRGSKAAVLKLIIKVTNLALEVDGATGVGFGAAVRGDFPEGNILLLGAVSYLKFATASASVQDAFDGDYSIGSTPTADATLSGTDANIVPSTALGAATSKTSPVVRGVSTSSGAVLDNTDGSLEININLIIDDANISANDVAFTANGYIVVLFSVMGDD
jgi:hypothetical protein